MTALVGIAAPNRKADLQAMLQQLSYRGIIDYIAPLQNATVGMVFTDPSRPAAKDSDLLSAKAGPGHFARAQVETGGISLSRDSSGVCPLYYGRDEDGVLYFASEVKALLPFTQQVKELPPGSRYAGGVLYSTLPSSIIKPLDQTPAEIAAELLQLLQKAVEVRAKSVPSYGSLLSGGLDSTVITAIARQHTDKLHTYAAGLAGAPDLLYAQKAADFFGSVHHERQLTPKELIELLPKVIFHLESFDALLVRSSILNYAAAEMAAGNVSALFSGEGADELFAGYDYLKQLPYQYLTVELSDLVNRLHNTALQRVDRCIQAHGMIGLVPMLDPQVVEFSRRIPVELKLHQGIEKWILRQASQSLLPPEISHRPKAKFWQGGGVGDQLYQYANETITEAEFMAERRLPNGWMLNTREELMYYRMFKEHFGELDDLNWMGRTKGSPVQYPDT